MLIAKYELRGADALCVCKRMQGNFSTTVFCNSFLEHLYQGSIIFVYTLEYNVPVVLYYTKRSFFYIKGRTQAESFREQGAEKVFGPKGKETTGFFKNLYSEEFQKLLAEY